MRAQDVLLKRLDTRVRESTSALVQLHGLVGQAGEVILQRLGNEFAIERAPDADKASVLGGLVSGALGGLAADLAAGGLTFGAGALLGGVAGALGARTLAQRYNAQRGTSGSEVSWSDAFLQQRLAAALLRYLAVAHFGRGRGEFVAGDTPEHWRESINATIAAHARGRGRAVAGTAAELPPQPARTSLRCCGRCCGTRSPGCIRKLRANLRAKGAVR